MRTALALSLAVASCAAPVGAAEAVRLRGRYQWDGGGAEGPLQATFTPQAGDTWRVSFAFRFDGRDLRYDGIASGTLEQGDLAGEVSEGTGGRTFTFKGSVRDGRFSGTHAERHRRGSEQSTGTLTLDR